MSLRPRTRRVGGALLAVAAGGLAMGARLAAAPPSALGSGDAKAAAFEAALARTFPTPRLYRMSMSAIGGSIGGTGAAGGGGPREGSEICIGAQVFRDLLRGVERRPGGAATSTGCTLTHERRADGWFRFETSCDRTAGAATTSHMVMEGTAKDMRQHMELVTDSATSDAPRVISRDARMVDAGPCPAGMKPGQLRAANGEISDLPGLSPRPAGETRKGPPK